MTTPNPGTPPPGGRGPEQMYELATVQPPAQANPDLWNNAESARLRFNVNILSGFLSIGQAIGSALADIAAAFFGHYNGDNDALTDFQDGQLALNQRIDLAEEISGYCNTYQDKNWRVFSGTRRIPFGHRIGPRKNAHEEDDGIVLDAPGTWRVDAMVTAGPGTILVGVPRNRIEIRVYSPTGGLHHTKHFQDRMNSFETTLSGSTTVVVEDPGYKVEVWWYHDADWWRLAGGTHKSSLSVNRWDINADDWVEDRDPPDGGDIT